MATTEKNSLEIILSKLFIQNELNDIGRFSRGKPLEKHLSAVQTKIDDLSVQEDKKAAILLKTLDEEVILELRSCHDYVEDYDYLVKMLRQFYGEDNICLLYTSPSPRDLSTSRMPSSA